MVRLFLPLALACLLVVSQAGPSAAEKRVALVVGNGAYASDSMRLDNPARDAALVSAALEQLGFEVETVADAGKDAMEDAVVRLAERGRDADVTLFYYAGHALQDLGKNYLMPVDGSLKAEQDLRRRFVRFDDVLHDLADVKGARIIILDACRDNVAVEALRAAVPRTRSTGVSRGLAAVPKISGMLVAFATQPDRVAADGAGDNSPFAAALAERLVEPGVELRTVLTRVRQDVARATANAQVPEVSDSLLGEIYLRPAEAVPTVRSDPSTEVPRTFDLAAETAFWQAVQQSGTRADYEDYLARFGDKGFYASLAARRLAEFDKVASAPSAPEAELAPKLGAPVVTEPAPEVPDLPQPPILAAPPPPTLEASIPRQTTPAPDAGSRPRGWIGVQVRQVTDEVATILALGAARGVLIAEVYGGGPAQRAGIEVGDVMLSFDGKSIKDMQDLPGFTAETPIGKAVDIVVLRKGAHLTKAVVIAPRPEEAKAAAPPPTPSDGIDELKRVFGMTLAPISPDLKKKFRIVGDETGVVVTEVAPKSTAAVEKLQAGDVIREVLQTKVTTPADVAAALAALRREGRKVALMTVAKPNGRAIFRVLPME